MSVENSIFIVSFFLEKILIETKINAEDCVEHVQRKKESLKIRRFDVLSHVKISPQKNCRCSSRNDHLISHRDNLSRNREWRRLKEGWMISTYKASQRCLTTAETQAQAVTVTGESESVSETKTVTTKAETVATERSRRDTSSNRSIDHRRFLLLTMDSLGRSFQRRWRGEPRAEQRGLRIELAFLLVILRRWRERKMVVWPAKSSVSNNLQDWVKVEVDEKDLSKRCEDCGQSLGFL